LVSCKYQFMTTKSEIEKLTKIPSSDKLTDVQYKLLSIN